MFRKNPVIPADTLVWETGIQDQKETSFVKGYDMFTQQEAREFVNDVLNNVIASGRDDLLNQFYGTNFTGHHLDQGYDIEDLKILTLKAKNNLVEFNYDIKEVLVLGDFIINTSFINWVDKTSNDNYKATQISVWLTEDKKIKESWIMLYKTSSTINQKIFQELNNSNFTTNMFSVQEAHSFFKELYLNIFINGKVDLLPNYYTSDFIGHSNSDLFDVEDIKNRVSVLHEYFRDIKHEVKKIMISDRLVTISSVVSFAHKKNLKIYEISQFGTYLIHDGKIKESWLVFDNELGSYRQYNLESLQDEADIMKPFEINQKNREKYIERIIAALKTINRGITLSARELECLYYYLSGYSAKETAEYMDISPRTVESYLVGIRNKFGCKNRIELRNILFPQEE